MTTRIEVEITDECLSVAVHNQLGLLVQSLQNERLEMSDETKKDIEAIERTMEFYG